MATYCTQQCFLFYLALTLVWTNSEDVHPTIHLSAEVGGNVTFPCPADKLNITFLYFQTGGKFIHGYHEHEDLRQYGFWENIRVDHNEKLVHMYNLNVSHNRLYECIVQFKNGKIKRKNIQLSVTANYTKPNVTKTCQAGVGCVVTCASHGGFPKTEMTWNVPVSSNVSSQMWRVINSSQVPSPVLFISYSMAHFNCSRGKLTHLSCSVGEINSDMFSVCEPEVEPDKKIPLLLAILAVVVIFMTVVITCCCRRWRGERGADAIKGIRSDGEIITLNAGKEAP
ncbi:uncharacterized protein LOC115053590 [Echeneis naucrates]|uniref:uncharacterized protein LOC115053590 n=1 Tax=Echeneis naucrates TaxID=173247 RepID=UPI0011140D1D|nr:uncharacterized protein LOC115053590 [Echeneis naucrates]